MLTRAAVACVAALATVLVLAGCSSLPRDPVPPELAREATIPGMPDIRARAGRPDPAMVQDYLSSMQQESTDNFPLGADGLVSHPHLALSGGGVNGAVGAGFLKG